MSFFDYEVKNIDKKYKSDIIETKYCHKQHIDSGISDEALNKILNEREFALWLT